MRYLFEKSQWMYTGRRWQWDVQFAYNDFVSDVGGQLELEPTSL